MSWDDSWGNILLHCLSLGMSFFLYWQCAILISGDGRTLFGAKKSMAGTLGAIATGCIASVRPLPLPHLASTHT